MPEYSIIGYSGLLLYICMLGTIESVHNYLIVSVVFLIKLSN